MIGSEAEPSSPFDGVDATEWAELVEVGRLNGEVDVETIHHVFREVDTLPDLVDTIERMLAAEGVSVVSNHDLDGDVTPTDGIERPTVPPIIDASDVDASGLLGRLRRRRQVKQAHERYDVSSSDNMRMYLREIGRVSLLTKAEEGELARAIEIGNAAAGQLDALQAAGTLDVATSRSLRNQVELGLLSKQELIQSNLRLVVSIAKRYNNRGMTLLDLIQEGNLGLMRAVDKFDHSKGFKFSTYATWWIRQAITRAIADQARTIRIPVHMVETMNRVLRVQRTLVSELHREPTVEEIAERCSMTTARVEDIFRIAQDPLSLDSPFSDQDDSSLADVVSDVSAVSPEQKVVEADVRTELKKLLRELNERDREIIELRFGLGGGQPQTLEDVGKAFGVTRERVRQIEAKTMARLRATTSSEKLRQSQFDE